VECGCHKLPKDEDAAEMKVWSSLLTMATIFFRNVWGCSVEPKIATMPHMIWRGEQRVLGEREAGLGRVLVTLVLMTDLLHVAFVTLE
jgi:hypothetical protein